MRIIIQCGSHVKKLKNDLQSGSSSYEEEEEEESSSNRFIKS